MVDNDFHDYAFMWFIIDHKTITKQYQLNFTLFEIKYSKDKSYSFPPLTFAMLIMSQLMGQIVIYKVLYFNFESLKVNK